MIRYLRRNQQVFIGLVVLYYFLIVFGNQLFFFKSINTEEYFSNSILFYFFNTDLLSGISPVLFAFISLICFLFIGFFLVRVTINNLILQSRSQFPALFIIVISFYSIQKSIFTMAIIGAFFLLIALDRLISSMEKQDLNYRYIDGGILIAIGSLFYTNILFFLPFFWVAQVIIRKVNTREVLFTIIGFTLPYLYLFASAYIFNYSLTDLSQKILSTITVKPDSHYSWQIIIAIAINFIFLVTASIFALLKFSSKKILSRKLYQLLFYLFLNCMVVFLFVPSVSFELFTIFSIPVAVLFSIYFTECKENIINNILLSIILIVPFIIIALKYFL